MASREQGPLVPFEFEKFPPLLSAQTMRVLDHAEQVARIHERSHIIPTDIFVGLVRTDVNLQEALVELNIRPEELIYRLVHASGGLKHPDGSPSELLFADSTNLIIKRAEEIAREKNSFYVEPIHVLSSYAKWNEGFGPQLLKEKYGCRLEAVLSRTQRLTQGSPM